ncbi:ribokinase [Tepidiforma sp.]|uniref:ribokinase n=1 Tax=Tepidiforma sp. TaxID=2682230 RepID=UPI0026067E80|nr:ribokinase [Tepidiforma sp.]MCX7616480.1 ribokinase [Tepidiforma sp.]
MARIAVVGSLMMDLVVRAPRPALPGESLIGRSFATFVGGKGGNQAAAAARLGASVAMVGAVGADPFGEAILASLAADGIDTAFVRRLEGEGTGVAVPVVFDDGSNLIYALPRANLALAPADVETARTVIEAADVLLVQFEVAPEATLAALRIARAAGVRTILNPAPIAPHPGEVFALADLLVPNEVEAAALSGAAGEPVEAQAAALRALGPQDVIITLGERGALIAIEAGLRPVPAPRVEAVDTVGAGDAFCGALAVRLAAGATLEEAAAYACRAAALACTKPGAAASLPSFDEVEEFTRRLPA